MVNHNRNRLGIPFNSAFPHDALTNLTEDRSAKPSQAFRAVRRASHATLNPSADHGRHQSARREADPLRPQLKGGGAAGVATVGPASVEVAQQVLAETQGAVLPLVPYLGTLRWLFIAAALAGIAVAIYARLDGWKKGRR